VDEQVALDPPQFIDWWRGFKEFVNVPHGPLSVSKLNSSTAPCGTQLGGECPKMKDGVQVANPFKCTEAAYSNLGCNHTAPGSNATDGMFYTQACLATGNVSSCPLLMFVDPGYDQGYMQSVFNNLGVKAAFAFPGWGPTQAWLEKRVSVEEPVMFYWWVSRRTVFAFALRNGRVMLLLLLLLLSVCLQLTPPPPPPPGGSRTCSSPSCRCRR
jgi:hypothetical protein